MGTKSKGGRWKVGEFTVRWFCRNCHQKGMAGITLHPKLAVNMQSAPTIGYDPPSANDVVDIISRVCHTNCKQPDIRFVEVSRKEKR